MTTTRTASGPRAFDPDHYLDCRRPGWVIYEARGLVQFRRELGARHSLVFVDDDCLEVLVTLRAHVEQPTKALR